MIFASLRGQEYEPMLAQRELEKQTFSATVDSAPFGAGIFKA